MMLSPTQPLCVPSWRSAWKHCSHKQRIDFLAALSLAHLELFANEWWAFARDDQWPPSTLPDGSGWTTWLMMGGRGAGKTRAGAEWVRGIALGLPGFSQHAVGRIALVGETAQDARDVMVEGVSGLLSIHPKDQRPQWQPSLKRLEWPNGAVAQLFSAEDPEGLRGPQFGAAWSDEIGKWKQGEHAFDMLQFALRLGRNPRQVATTTPRATPLVKRLLADPRTVTSRATTRMNRFNLAPAFLETVVARYAGTRLGRQELEGELIEERADALWTRGMIEAARLVGAPPLVRIVVAVDPPASSGKRADACGIVAAGIDGEGMGYVLADATLEQARPQDWANAAIALYRRLEADALVVEVNQGGEMATAVIAEIDPGVPVTPVRATRGKYLRAEPVAALYGQGRVRHIGAMPQLEDEMCDFGAGGLSSGRSPDRLDALVWALTHLMLGPKGRPRVRGL
jgi:phage terminase large subunit-like protein